MSLMRLLTVGRSIGTINNQPSRYKMTQQNLLPKFVAPNRTEPKAREPASTASKHARVKQLRSTWKSMMKKKEKMNPESSGQVGETKDSASAEVPKPAFPSGRWSIIKNPFSPHRIHKAELPPVQGELSLNMVKPVRNDLSDADLEIVLVRKEPMKSEPKPATGAVEKREPVGYLWSRLASRLFRTEQS